MSEDKELKKRLKQWKRVSKYLRRSGYAIEACDDNLFKVCLKRLPDIFVFVRINDACTVVFTPHESVLQSMFPGKSTEWLFQQIWDITIMPFNYDREHDEIYASVLLQNTTDNMLFETVRLYWEGYHDLLATIANLEDKVSKGRCRWTKSFRLTGSSASSWIA